MTSRRRIAGLVGVAMLVTALSASVRPGSAAFPGMNGKITFESHRDGNCEIYVMNPDGSGQANLTNHPACDSQPAWSADGSKITFTSDRTGGSQVWMMNADGSNPMQVTNDPGVPSPGGRGAFDPTWSPDGMWIAFTSTRNGGFNAQDIFKIHPNGTGETPLATTPGVQENSPAWAPDNSKIVYNRHTFFADNELFTMNPDGSGQALLPPSLLPQGIQRKSPGWSPDAQKVIFSGDRPGQGHQIFTTNADGSGGVTELTAGSPLSNTTPAFAPDGSQVVFTSSRDGNHEIYVMNANGTGQTRRTINAAVDNDPDWGPLRVPNHFLRYQLDQPEATGETVTLVDQFGERRVRLEEAEWLWNPAEKRRTGRPVEPIQREDEHLVCYGLPYISTADRFVVVRNQFTTSTLRVGRPLTLCTPASKSLVGEVGPPPEDLDHFLCYDVRGESPLFTSETLVVRDQFGERTIRIDRARELCNPAEKRRDGREPEPIIRPEEHYVCYRITTQTPLFTPLGVFTRDQFFFQGLRVTTLERLCVPSTKDEGGAA